jgi:hypothetical protein
MRAAESCDDCFMTGSCVQYRLLQCGSLWVFQVRKLGRPLMTALDFRGGLKRPSARQHSKIGDSRIYLLPGTHRLAQELEKPLPQNNLIAGGGVRGTDSREQHTTLTFIEIKESVPC